MRADSAAMRYRPRRLSPARLALRWLLVVGVVVAVVAALVGVFYAGSPERLAEGVTIAGVDVGGLTADKAVATLEARAETLSDRPVVFTAGPDRFPIKPSPSCCAAASARSAASAACTCASSARRSTRP